MHQAIQHACAHARARTRTHTWSHRTHTHTDTHTASQDAHTHTHSLSGQSLPAPLLIAALTSGAAVTQPAAAQGGSTAVDSQRPLHRALTGSAAPSASVLRPRPRRGRHRRDSELGGEQRLADCAIHSNNCQRETHSGSPQAGGGGRPPFRSLPSRLRTRLCVGA